jgi:hypothetical protein
VAGALLVHDGIRRMPAGAKMSIGSMKAEPMMPNMSVTPLAARVSTNASEGVIFCGPAGMAAAAAAAAFWSVMSFMGVSSVVIKAVKYGC